MRCIARPTDRQGRFQKFIAICTEITARKRLKQELESSRAFLQSVTDSMGEGVYTLDQAGRCTFLNAEGERLIGWSFEEARGRILHDLVHTLTGDEVVLLLSSGPLDGLARSLPALLDDTFA